MEEGRTTLSRGASPLSGDGPSTLAVPNERVAASIENWKQATRPHKAKSRSCDSAEGGGVVHRRGDFYWSVSSAGKCTVRSRAGTRIPGDRIALEEYQEAIVAVLTKGHAFSRTQLVNEVRSVFGFSRTGAVLDDAINSAIDTLLVAVKLGEGSTGIRQRK